MTNRASEKIIDALTQLIEGYNELQESLGYDFEGHDDDEDGDMGDENINPELEASIVSEMHSALDAVIDSEDVSAEEIAMLLSSLTEALEEIDPSVFEPDEEDDEVHASYDEDDDMDYFDDDDEELDDDFDDDDDDYDDDDDDEEED
ncbi:MAG: hypothetical protein ACOX2O_02955 [Bdellovibrionota bacterium]|jgi:hypothetical protein